MLNRRIIRIKILQTLFSYYSGSLKDLQAAENDLKYALDKSYDLYFFIFLLIIEIQDFANVKIQNEKSKFMPNENVINPYKKFMNNRLIAQLKENIHLNTYLKDNKYTWYNDADFLKKLHEEFIKHPDYQAYVVSSDNSYEQDQEIIINFVENFLFNSELFYNKIEEESIYWVDGVDYVLRKVAKTLSKFTSEDTERKKLSKKFKNKDDLAYSIRLLHKTVLNKPEYAKIIQDNIVNWDFDRISFIDKIILQLSVAELVDFEDIPIKVTLNEYIELAKWYGIPKKSSNFVNGILDKIVKDLTEKEKIVKVGRGLKDN